MFPTCCCDSSTTSTNKPVSDVGIGSTGAAIIDPQLQMATITIDSSNYPHGVLQFSPTSLEIIKEEQDITINLQIERKFGNIGNVIKSCQDLRFFGAEFRPFRCILLLALSLQNFLMFFF